MNHQNVRIKDLHSFNLDNQATHIACIPGEDGGLLWFPSDTDRERIPPGQWFQVVRQEKAIHVSYMVDPLAVDDNQKFSFSVTISDHSPEDAVALAAMALEAAQQEFAPMDELEQFEDDESLAA